MNIQEIKSLEDGAEIKPFTARLAFINNRTGKVQTCQIEDSTGRIKIVLIGRPDVSAALKGKETLIVGGIAQDNHYNGTTTREVKLLARGSFDPQGSVSIPAPMGTSAPAAKPNGSAPSQGNGNSNGAKSGMCIKAAHDFLLERYKKGEVEAEWFGTHEFGVALRTHASEVYRASQALEDGKLVPPAKEREALVAALVAASQDNVIQAAQEFFGEAGEGE